MKNLDFEWLTDEFSIHCRGHTTEKRQIETRM